MKNIRRIIILLFSFCISCFLNAQEADKGVKMDDLMRSSGRIYVVVAVMLTILIVLILYLVRLDKKMKKLEQQIK